MKYLPFQEALNITLHELDEAKQETEEMLHHQAEEMDKETDELKDLIVSLEGDRDSLSSQVFVLEEQVRGAYTLSYIV